MSHKGTNYSLPVYGDFSVADLVMFLGIDMSDVEVETTYISPLDDVIIKKIFVKCNLLHRSIRIYILDLQLTIL